MKFDFSHKTAIVTGGTRGIGESIVAHLQELGSDVIYTGTQSLHFRNTSKGTYAQLDFCDNKSVERFIKEVVQVVPQIDILINNAGINVIESIDELKDENWEKILKVNLTGPMHLMREVSKNMKRRGNGGKILNISSIWGIISKSKRGAYSASKTGLIGLTRASALDLAPYNILVNALCPGITQTELTDAVLSPEDKKNMNMEIPLGRFAQVSEMATIAVFLCSDFNTYITGQTLIADGGFTIR